MSFSQSISTCMRKYITFSGRATRSEYWWFYLFTLLMCWGVDMVADATFPYGNLMAGLASTILALLFLIPTISAGSRRLHDIGKSGWWQLLWFIPIIGWVLIIIWLASDTKEAGNKYN